MKSPARHAFVATGGALTAATAAVAATVMAWRTQRAVREAQRELLAALPRHGAPAEPIVAAVRAEAADLSSAIADIAKHHADASAGLSEQLESVSGDLAESIAGLQSARARQDGRHRELVKRLDSVHREERQLYWQLEALLDLRAQLPPRAPLPQLRGWAASPDVLHWMLTWARYHEPRLIVECGSGVSTVLFGYHVQRAGTGRVVALEHDGRFAAQTVELAQRHGVDDVVEVREAPLQEWRHDGRQWRWYDLNAVEDLADIDLLFIDGPPQATGELARLPAGPVLLERLSASGVAVLDDTGREDESQASDMWLEQLPDLGRERLKTDKGTDVFRRHVR